MRARRLRYSIYSGSGHWFRCRACLPDDQIWDEDGDLRVQRHISNQRRYRTRSKAVEALRHMPGDCELVCEFLKKGVWWNWAVRRLAAFPEAPLTYRKAGRLKR